MGKPLPLSLISNNAVQEVEHWIFLVLGIAGRSIDLHLARCAHRFGLVFNHLQRAMRNAIALLVKPGRRIVEGSFVIGSEHDRPAESARPTARPFTGWSIGGFSRGRVRRGGLDTRSLEVLLGEVAHFTRERDVICADLSGVTNAHFVALEGEHFHKRQGVAGELGLFELHLTFLTTDFSGRFPGDFPFIHLEGEKVFLLTNLRVELRTPLAGNIRSTRCGRGKQAA